MYKSYFKESLTDFKGSDADIKEVTDWINSLNLKTGKAPSGMKKQIDDVKFIAKQIELLKDLRRLQTTYLVLMRSISILHLVVTCENVYYLIEKCTRDKGYEWKI